MITLANGSRVQASELVGKEFTLMTLVDGKPTPAKARAERNRTEPVYRITTETGKMIVRNAEHPLWVADGVFANGRNPKIAPKGWTATGDIVAGQLVAVAEVLPAFGDEPMSEDEIKILAYLIGDGGFTASRIIFSQQDNEQFAEFRGCVEAVGSALRKLGSSPYDHTVTGKKGGPRRKGACKSPSGVMTHAINPVRDLLARHGLSHKHSRDKRIPDAIFRLPREGVALFLSRLYATDGWACVGDGCAEVGFCSASEGLARDMQDLLVRFGIHATLSRRKKTAAWTLNILTAADILRFADRIGIFGKGEAMAKAIAKAGLATYAGKKWRHDKAHPGTRWEKVLSVELLPDAETVAIEVPEHHTFLTQFWEHNTFLAACLTSWWYDTRTEDSAVITTAPTKDAVKDLLWSEVRRQRGRAGLPDDFIGGAAPEMKTAEDHFAKGIAVESGEAFQGRHFGEMLFIFDEAIGISPIFWTTTESMFKPTGRHGWLVILNPTKTASQAYMEEMAVGIDGNPKWHVVTMGGVEHPNIADALAGREPGIPSAIEIEQVDGWVGEWCDRIPPEDFDPLKGDFQWRPGSGRFFRPTPQFDCRAKGLWPQQDSGSVWSDLAWAMATSIREQVIAPGELPVIGVDMASTGGDCTEMHTRWGSHSVAHEKHNGWLEDRTAGRLKTMCAELAAQATARQPSGKAPVKPEDIPVHYDGDGRGGALATHKGDYKFVPVCASSGARAAGKYPNRRSELWFSTLILARAKMVNFSRLPKDVQARLRQEAMAPKWSLDAAGREVVEKKEITKKLLKRSPDGMDSVNLAYVRAGDFAAPSSAPAAEVQREGRRFGDAQMAGRSRGSGLFGR